PSLLTLLRSLAEQQHLPRRIVLVDDRRCRPGPLLAEPIPRPLRGRVDVVTGHGRGPAAARNAGWQRTQARWVAFLDDDVLPPPDWSAGLVTDLRDAERAGVAAAQGRVEVPLPAGRRPTDAE